MLGLLSNLFAFDLKNPTVIDSTKAETKAFLDTIISYNQSVRPTVYLDTLYVLPKKYPSKNDYGMIYRYNLGKKPPIGRFSVIPKNSQFLNNPLLFDKNGNFMPVSMLNINNQAFNFNIYKKNQKQPINLYSVEPIILIRTNYGTKFYLPNLKSKEFLKGRATLMFYTGDKKNCKNSSNLKQVLKFVDDTYICKYVNELIQL